MSCDETLNTQAFFDGELTGSAAAEAESHAATCPDCRQLLDVLGDERRAIRSETTYHAASQDFRDRLAAAIDDEDARRSLSSSRADLSFGKALRAAQWQWRRLAALAIFVLSPTGKRRNDRRRDERPIFARWSARICGLQLERSAGDDGWLAAHTGLSPLVGARNSCGLSSGRRPRGLCLRLVIGGDRLPQGQARGKCLRVGRERRGESSREGREQGLQCCLLETRAVVFCAVSNLPIEDLEEILELFALRLTNFPPLGNKSS